MQKIHTVTAHNKIQKSLQLNLQKLWILGFLISGAVAFWNIGIIALDDYSNGISVMVPAQNQPPYSEVINSGVHPPIPKLILQKLSLFVWKVGGIQDPIWQLRWSLLFLGLFSFCINAYCFKQVFSLEKDALVSEQKKMLAVGALGFYFACPLFFSRPMIESLSLPFLTLSATFACLYHSKSHYKFLFLSLFALVVASLMRFQVGVCWVVLFSLIFFNKNKISHLGIFLVSSFLFFVLTGFIDPRAGFHESLRAYVDYNFFHATEYHGRMPFYVFPALFIGLSIPPAFFSRYKHFDWRKNYASLLPIVLFFVVFVLAHTLTPHKEERFMIPVLPLFILLLVPLARYWIWENPSRWRIFYFAIVNGILLLFTSVDIPQNNVIGIARHLRNFPEINVLISPDKTLPFFPSAFITRPIGVTTGSPQQVKSCHEWFIIREADLDLYSYEKLRIVDHFYPGFFEGLFVKLNPKQNARRGPLVAFELSECLKTNL